MLYMEGSDKVGVARETHLKILHLEQDFWGFGGKWGEDE